MSIDREELLALPVREKLDLVEFLWDNLAAATQPLPLPEWIDQEGVRRREEMLADPMLGLSQKCGNVSTVGMIRSHRYHPLLKSDVREAVERNKSKWAFFQLDRKLRAICHLFRPALLKRIVAARSQRVQLDVNGNPPALADCRCDAILCQQYWHCGQLIEPSNVAYLCFNSMWFRLYFDHGIIFWRRNKQGPEPFEVPEIEASYRIDDVATRLRLVGVRLHKYDMVPTELGSQVIFEFRDGRRLTFSEVDDVTAYHFE